MKKHKKFGKTQVALAVMVVALAAAVWLNMKYSAAQTQAASSNDGSSKYLGQAEYVNASVSGATYDEPDYFKELRTKRKEAREEALAILEETLDRDDLTSSERQAAAERSAAIAEATEAEAAIETVLKAKGFNNVLAIIGDDDVNVAVDIQPDAAQAVQIQEAVMSQTSFGASQIKIISAQ